jgi:hypothetical protein
MLILPTLLTHNHGTDLSLIPCTVACDHWNSLKPTGRGVQAVLLSSCINHDMLANKSLFTCSCLLVLPCGSMCPAFFLQRLRSAFRGVDAPCTTPAYHIRQDPQSRMRCRLPVSCFLPCIPPCGATRLQHPGTDMITEANHL